VKFLKRRKTVFFRNSSFSKISLWRTERGGKGEKEVRVYLSVFLVEFLRMADRHHLVKGLGAWLN